MVMEEYIDKEVLTHGDVSGDGGVIVVVVIPVVVPVLRLLAQDGVRPAGGRG